MSAAQSYSFGSASGTTLAFYFFLCLAVFIGVAIYTLCTNPMVCRFGGAPTRRATAIGVGLVASLTVFLGIYFSSLDGFYRMNIQGEEVRLIYILPERVRVLQRREIAGVTERPAYKTLWQLVIRTQSGKVFTSARSDFSRVRMARQRLASEVRLR
jgi:hypothetical protein